jgi:nondiscriminating glutamyl-tRNA synthetase
LVPENKRHDFMTAIKPNVQFPHEVKAWANAVFGELSEWTQEQQEVIHGAGTDYFTQAIIALEQHGPHPEKITTHLKETCNVKGKALFLPLRVALTGYAHGPDLALLFSLMDVRTIKRRFETGMR